MFHFATGKLLTTIDESIEALTVAQEAQDNELTTIDNPADFQLKMQTYKEAMRQWDSMDRAFLPSLVFDESSSLLCYTSPIGVKTVNFATGEVLKVFGKSEQGDVYLQVALYQMHKHSLASATT